MSQHGAPERLTGKSKPLDEEVTQGQGGGGGGSMEILVESLTGSAFQMTVSPSDTVYAIKSKIFRVEGVHMAHQHLLYNLKELEDSCSLSDYNIKDGATLRLVLSIRGGPISIRRFPLPTVEDLQWRGIKDFVENNRDEAVDWLPPGCKVLVVKDGDNVNLLKVIEDDDDDDHYTTLSDYSFSDETAVTMCKMIDLRSKMEKLSMKRNKKKLTSRSRLWSNRVENAPAPVIKRTTSEENISSTFRGDDTANFTKYKYGKMSSSRASDDNMSNYCSIFQVEPCSCKSSNTKKDKFELWQPFNSLSEVSNNESSSSKTWQACSSRTSSSSDFFKTNNDCSSSTESFKEAILGGTLGNSATKLDPADVDTFGESSSSRKGFLRENGGLLGSDVISQSNSSQCNPSAGGSGPGGVVLETTTAPALPLPLVAHSPNTESNYGDFKLAQLLSNDASPSTSSQFEDQYYYNTGPASTQLKRIVRKMMFRSNSHLNSTPDPLAEPSHSLGSEPQLDQLDDLAEERIPPRNTTLSSSISNLFYNSHGSNRLSVPNVDRTWSSELDKAESIKYKRTCTVRPGNMVFSSSTSDLLGLKRHKILPSLSRHPNCERLDVSDDSLHNIDVTKNDTRQFKSIGDTILNNTTPIETKKPSIQESPCGPSIVSWPTSDMSTKTISDIRPRLALHLSDKSNRNSIRYMQNDNSSDDFSSNSSNVSSMPFQFGVPGTSRRNLEVGNVSSVPFQFGVPGTSRRNLEVGSERRCRRIKKILKLDHNNLAENKSRLDTVSRRSFLLGYESQGYEASIEKMPNQVTREVIRSPEKSEGQIFTPLYERCLGVYSNTQYTSNKKTPFLIDQKVDNNTSKLLRGLKSLNTSVENVEEKKQPESSTSQPHQVPQDSNNEATKKPKRIRCAFCKKRLSVASIHTCRCGVIFCAPHRYAEVHGCQYDYKAEGQEYLRRANPLVSAPKLPKI